MAPKIIKDQKKVFFGIRADSRIFDLYRTLLMKPEDPDPRAKLSNVNSIPVTTR